MNTVPVPIYHAESGVFLFGDVPTLGRTRRRVVHMDPMQLANVAALSPADHEALSPFRALEIAAAEPETLREFLADIDRVGMSNSVDLAVWVDEAFPATSRRGCILEWLDSWVTDHDDCPGLPTLLDEIDIKGLGRSFDLMFWLDRWRRA